MQGSNRMQNVNQLVKRDATNGNPLIFSNAQERKKKSYYRNNVKESTKLGSEQHDRYQSG